MLYRYLLLAFVPPSYQDPAARRPRRMHHLHSVVFDHSGRVAVPAWLGPDLDRPVVYATFGTELPNIPVLGVFPALFRAVIGGLPDEIGTLVITVSRGKDAAALGGRPGGSARSALPAERPTPAQRDRDTTESRATGGVAGATGRRPLGRFAKGPDPQSHMSWVGKRPAASPRCRRGTVSSSRLKCVRNLGTEETGVGRLRLPGRVDAPADLAARVRRRGH